MNNLNKYLKTTIYHIIIMLIIENSITEIPLGISVSRMDQKKKFYEESFVKVWPVGVSSRVPNILLTDFE